jgi:adenine-specific DNA-methyltransferase
LFQRTEEQLSDYKNPDNDDRGVWRASDLSARTPADSCIYEIIGPTGEKFLPPPTRSWAVSREKFQELVRDNRIWWGIKKTKRPMFKKFLTEVKSGITPETWWPREFADDNKIAKYESKDIFSGDSFGTPKPEKLLFRILQLSTSPGDYVLDSFLGSGTTAAVAHKMGRRYIGVEMREQAKTHCAARLKKVIDGEQGGISEAVGWKGGGGFRFFKLGEAVFDNERRIKPDISFENLAAHIWFTETKTPLKKQTTEKRTSVVKSPFLGVHGGTAYALLYNGILGDKSVRGGNVLTRITLNRIIHDIETAAKKNGKKAAHNKLIIYGEATRFSAARLNSNNIEFKQTPYDIKVW